MLIAEELFLLLTTDEGARKGYTARSYGLTGAVITDLVLHDRIELSDDKDPRVVVLDPSPTGHPVLDPALARLVEKNGKRLSSTVQDGRLNPEKDVAAELAAHGLVDVEEKSFLGIKSAKYPERDGAAEQQLRARLRDVLHGAPPTVADATLLSILHGGGVLKSVMKDETDGFSRKELEQRVDSLEVPGDVGRAVKRSVEAMNAAVMSAVIIPAVVSGAS